MAVSIFIFTFILQLGLPNGNWGTAGRRVILQTRLNYIPEEKIQGLIDLSLIFCFACLRK